MSTSSRTRLFVVCDKLGELGQGEEVKTDRNYYFLSKHAFFTKEETFLHFTAGDNLMRMHTPIQNILSDAIAIKTVGQENFTTMLLP